MHSQLTVTLVDINTQVVRALRAAFSDLPQVNVVEGSILDQEVDAWVSPTNSRGSMDGGVDAIIKDHLGANIEKKVQRQIKTQFGGTLPVGAAVCVPTGDDVPRFLISVPTMSSSAERIRDTTNVALACAAAFQMIHLQNAEQPGSIQSVAIPGLGSGTGGVPLRVCANLMWTAYLLFDEFEFPNFERMREAVHEQVEGVSSWTDDTKVRVQVPEGWGDVKRRFLL